MVTHSFRELHTSESHTHQICMNWGMPNSRKYAAMDRRWWAKRALVHVPFHFIYILVLLHSLNTRWCFIAIHIQLMQCIGSAAIWSDLLMCTMLRRHINPKYIWLLTANERPGNRSTSSDVAHITICWVHPPLLQAYNEEETLAISSQVMNSNNFRIVPEDFWKLALWREAAYRRTSTLKLLLERYVCWIMNQFFLQKRQVYDAHSVLTGEKILVFSMTCMTEFHQFIKCVTGH